MTGWALRVGGRWAAESGHVGPITFQTIRMGGMGGASWQWQTVRGDAPMGLYRDSPCEVWIDGQRKWHGYVDGIDPVTWDVTAVGKWAATHRVPAITEAGTITDTIRDAVSNATGFGLDIRGATTAFSTGDRLDMDSASATPMMLGEMLELFAQREGVQVGVDANNHFYRRPDPSAPKWMITSTDVRLAAAGGEPYNRVMGWALNPAYNPGDPLSTEPEKHTVFSPAPPPGVPQRIGVLDLTRLGMISYLDASAYATKVAMAIDHTPRLAEAVTLSSYDIRSVGGRPADLLTVKGGDMARLMGLTPAEQAQAGAPYLDVVIDKVTHTEGVDAIEIEFAGTLPTSLEDAYAALVAENGLTA